VTLAAYGVGSNILQFVTIPAMGLSMSVSTLVSQNIGAGNIERAARVTVLGAAAGFVILTVVGVAAYLLAPALVQFFVSGSPEVVAEGARFIRIMCLAWGAIGVQLSIVSAFRASGNMLAAMVIALVAQFMLQFPLAYILARHTTLAAAGLWWSFPVANILVAIVSACGFAAGGWKQTRLTDEDIQVAEIAEKTITEDSIR
jgi:Na+-driven multidrug efflux pump